MIRSSKEQHVCSLAGLLCGGVCWAFEVSFHGLGVSSYPKDPLKDPIIRYSGLG